jgi:hypothetical protein
MVPLQIDLAIGAGRYLLVRTANPGVREPAVEDAASRDYRTLLEDSHCAIFCAASTIGVLGAGVWRR